MKSFPWRVHYKRGSNITESRRNAVLIREEKLQPVWLRCLATAGLTRGTFFSFAEPPVKPVRAGYTSDQMTALIWLQQPSPPSGEAVEQQEKGDASHSSMNTNLSSQLRQKTCFRKRRFWPLHKSIVYHLTSNLSSIQHDGKPIQLYDTTEKKTLFHYTSHQRL